MSIIYSFVARGKTILAEYSDSTGNFKQACRQILGKIGQKDTKMTYVYDKYNFHFISEKNLIYMCMADENFERRIAFAFLQDIKGRFQSEYGTKGQNAIYLGMNEDFAQVLQRQMKYFSSNLESDKIGKVKNEIEDVKQIMSKNIEKVIERGDKIEILVDKTEHLRDQSFKFKRQSTKLKRHMWYKNCKLIMMIFVVLIIYFILAGACGGLGLPKCTGKK
ncbi:vesicle-associated membrane protein [Anaeramoeba ignava]|uniref:Vesicle-associated membrane protein n=1 Tax=Anaeramoeba ignava TaxID=1746090 RepID=A0A9Q0LB98_ANAIG|nr:vesicle-associated membrane protein [Anaeramoeba ignava]